MGTNMADDKREVIVTDVKMPFWSMVVLLVKLALAGIPAAIILTVVAALLMAGMGMIFGTGWHHWQWGGTGTSM